MIWCLMIILIIFFMICICFCLGKIFASNWIPVNFKPIPLCAAWLALWPYCQWLTSHMIKNIPVLEGLNSYIHVGYGIYPITYDVGRFIFGNGVSYTLCILCIQRCWNFVILFQACFRNTASLQLGIYSLLRCVCSLASISISISLASLKP